MQGTNENNRVGMSAQTSVAVASTGGHGGELRSPLRVANDRTAISNANTMGSDTGALTLSEINQIIGGKLHKTTNVEEPSP